jgi:uncharacterized membrane protein (DUF485 family)
MQPPQDEWTKLVHSESFLRSLMRRQLVLSIACGIAFVAILLGLPLANYFLPELMATRVFGGFTLSWFLLGIGVFPVVWLISWIFIRCSIAMEEQQVREAQASARRGETPRQ